MVMVMVMCVACGLCVHVLLCAMCPAPYSSAAFVTIPRGNLLSRVDHAFHHVSGVVYRLL